MRALSGWEAGGTAISRARSQSGGMMFTFVCAICHSMIWAHTEAFRHHRMVVDMRKDGWGMGIETTDDPATTTGATAARAQGLASTSTSAALGRRARVWGAASLRRARRADWVALGALLVAFIYRLTLIARGWPQLDSDEAVIGLMARHILQGEYPVFFWGQNYMGAFQAYFAAIFFAVFGPSTFWLHVSVLLLTMGFLAAMYGLASAAYGRVVGVVTLLWLAVGPTMGVLRELKAIGGYQDILLFGALTLLGVWARLRQPQRMPHTQREWLIALATYAGLGVAMGVGLWSDLLILPVLLLAAIALLVGRPREVFSWLGLALLVAFVISAYPYISFNIVHPNATFIQLAKMNHAPGQVGPIPPPHNWAMQMGETLEVALPTILGSPYVCVKVGNIWSDYPTTMATATRVSGGVCDLTNLAFSLGALALYIVALLPIVLALWRWAVTQLRLAREEEADAEQRADPNGRLRHWRRVVYRAARANAVAAFARDGAAPTAEQRAHSARLARDWLRLLLVGVGVANVLAYSTSVEAQTFQFTSARYLLLVYLSAPIFIGVLWGGAQPVARWLAARRHLPGRGDPHVRLGIIHVPGYASPSERQSIWRGVWTAISALGLAALLALSLYGGAQTLAYTRENALFHAPMPVEDQQIIAFLGAHDIHAFYGDYWTCYRLAFESRERAICAVRGGDPPHTLDLTANRYVPYMQTLAHTAHPAYIYLADSQQDRSFDAYAAAQGLPHIGYRRVVIGAYAVYYYP